MESPKDKTEHRIEFEPVGKSAQCAEGESLLEASRRAGIELISICGGRGTCHRCRVQIISGDVGSATTEEEHLLGLRDLVEGYRLACQARPLSDCKVHVPSESISALQRAQIESQECFAAPDPPVRAYHLDLMSMFLSDPSADSESLLEMVLDQHRISYRTVDVEALRQFSQQSTCQRHIRASVRGDEVIALGPWPGAQLGLAIDLGTTKIAGYLVDLDSGATVAAQWVSNPQAAYGEDIIARLTHARDAPSGSVRLRDLTVDALNSLLAHLCGEKIQAEPQQVVEAVIVGNTAMHHLVLHLPVEGLLRPPFTPAVKEALDVKARDLGLCIAPGAYVHFLPNIAGFVGSDHVAMLLTIRDIEASELTLAIDIGTNTEVSLISKGGIASVSCASGPAFEGGHIKCGMKAVPGAIERLRLTGDVVEYQTIGRGLPIGICGSGIIDAVSQLYLAGVLDVTGRMHDHLLVRGSNGQREFVVVSEGAHGKHPTITVTQQDIREVQLAKAAIRTGIQVLLDSMGVAERDIMRVVVAGAFGTYLDLTSSITIGMLPSLPLDRFRQVGNAAGAGARMALVSTTERVKAQALSRRIRYIELSTAPDFARVFTRATRLGPYGKG